MIPRHYILDSKIAKIREKLNASTISKAKNYEKYKHLLAAFDGAEDLRSSVYGIKNIYKGYDANWENGIELARKRFSKNKYCSFY